MKKTIAFVFSIMAVLPVFAGSPNVPTSEKYVDDKMDEKQNLFGKKSSDTVVVYSSQQGVTGERAIRGDLDGVSLNDNAISTVGALDRRALNYKLDAFANLPSSNVMTYHDRTLVAARPIYSANTAFKDALVDAETANAAIINAIENEFTAVDANGNPDPNGTLWRLNTAPVAPITIASNLGVNENGTGFCYKSATGAYKRRGTCSTTLYNGLANGGWGAVFSYGEVSGISVCTSALPPDFLKYAGGDADYNGKYIVENQSAIQQYYNSGNSSGMFCYYKMTGPLASPWIFGGSAGSATSCSNACANMAGYNIANVTTWRSVTYGALTTSGQ